MALHVR